MDTDDDQWKGCAAVWGGALTEVCWRQFSDPANFGSAFEGIRALRGKDPNLVAATGFGSFAESKRFAKGLPRDLEQRAARGDDGLRVYCEKFAHFFNREFLPRRMFEVMNAENQPQYVGFRKAAESLYQNYRAEVLCGKGEVSLIEYAYAGDDGFFTQLNVGNVIRYFSWLGVLKE
mmetsp:Transcript_50170/g.85920  ORF Transcript_50170/g.85920 Transcript_50170/m.85920 type:complete len:176 (+) Transcript_50170:1-528(+)